MITKKLYKECVQAILDFNEEDMKIYKATNGFVDFTHLDTLSDLVIKFEQLLEYCTKDKIADSIVGTNLQYFIYDLNGGKNYKSGSIKDEANNDLSCKDIDELWTNFIIAEHPEVEDRENV